MLARRSRLERDRRRPCASVTCLLPSQSNKLVDAFCGSLVRRGCLSRCAHPSPCGTHLVSVRRTASGRVRPRRVRVRGLARTTCRGLLRRSSGASSPLASSSAPAVMPAPLRARETQGARGLDSKSCPPGIWTIYESRLGTPANGMTCTRPRSTDRGPLVRHACASSNENASGQKDVFAPLRPRNGASAPLTTPLRIRADGPAHAAPHL